MELELEQLVVAHYIHIIKGISKKSIEIFVC